MKREDWVSFTILFSPVWGLGLVVIVAFMAVTGCAGQTPLQRISAGIDILQTMPIHVAVNADIDAALAWVNGPDAPTDPQELFEARQCPTALDFIRKGNAADLAEIQQIMADVDTEVTDLASGKSPTLLADILRHKYGKKRGGDPQARIAALKTKIFQRYTLGRNSCAGLFSGIEQFGVEQGLKYFTGM